MAEEMNQRIKEFPHLPGVYLMKSDRGKTLYIGKAKDLKKRIRSYFLTNRDIKTRILVKKIKDIEIIVTESEYQALVVENDLIKKNQPKYNINLKDGKTYPVIRITNELFPRVFRTRRLILDGSLYFGPFPGTEQLDIYLDIIKKYFLLRKCRRPWKKRSSPCLYYYMERCKAPCCGKISVDEYNKIVGHVKKLLKGGIKEIITNLDNNMNQAARHLEYERAARFRDQLNSLKQVSQELKIINPQKKATDYIGYAVIDNLCSFVVLQVRQDKIIGQDIFRTDIFSTIEEVLNQFLIQYYNKVRSVPKRICVPDIVEQATITEYFKRIKGIKVKITAPQRGYHKKLQKMAMDNAQQDININSLNGLFSLKQLLQLENIPRRIEGFDIAHLAGKYTVASMVSFLYGKPDKKAYRRFKIKTLDDKIDDYEAIREVIARRYMRVVNENLEKPDLIVIDGGKGQLSAALSILTTLGLKDVPLLGLAKRQEEIFLVSKNKPVILDQGSPTLKLLQRVRDEAHRFATGYHKQLRDRKYAHSLLEKVKGIGPAKSKQLLKQFTSIKSIKQSDARTIARAAGISEKLAQKVLEMLKNTAPQINR